jgi:bacillithiol biosynthesis cysteine-adding enzyme BshC
MRIRDLLPDSSVVKRYLNGDPALEKLSSGSLLTESLKFSCSFSERSPEVRKAVVGEISAQYKRSGLPIPAHLSDLLIPSSRTITAGHQVVIGTGPIFSIYKALTAVALAHRLSVEWDTPVLPIFWMATEDHDFAEVASLTVAGGTHFTWDGPPEMQGGDYPVGRMNVAGLTKVLKDWAAGAGLPEAWTDGLIADTHGSLADSFRRWMHRALGDTTLILIDADAPALKSFFSSAISRELSGNGIESDVLQANQTLASEGIKPQAHVRSVNLFQFIDGRRIRVEAPAAEVSEVLTCDPADYSPNALLRPLYQSTLLPDVGAVGGPGETAYWLQLRGAFDRAGMMMPVLVPRHGGLIIAPALYLTKLALGLGIGKADLNREIQLSKAELTREVIGRALPHPWLERRDELKAWVEKSATLFAELDQTLEPTARGSGVRILKEMEKLEVRLRRTVKGQRPDLLEAIEDWFSVVSPGGVPQERALNYFELAAAWDSSDMHGLANEILSSIQAQFGRDLQPSFHLIDRHEPEWDPKLFA